MTDREPIRQGPGRFRPRPPCRPPSACRRVRAHVQHRAVESQQGQGRAQANQALPGEHPFDMGQRKGRCPLAVGDHHVVEDEIRIQPLPARLDTADAHRLPDRPAGCLLDLGSVIGDLGQHRIAQGEHQGGKGQPGGKQRPARPAKARRCPAGPGWATTSAGGGRSRRPYVLRNHAGMSAGRLSHRQTALPLGGIAHYNREIAKTTILSFPGINAPTDHHGHHARSPLAGCSRS